MKSAIGVFALMLFAASCFGQRVKNAPPPPSVGPATTLSKQELLKIKRLEDTLRYLSNQMIDDTISDKRKKYCYSFIPKFVEALKMPNSFYYPFDSLETVTKVYPQDSTFRIFTWQLYFTVPITLPAKYSRTGRDTFFDRPIIRYYGVIQMRSKELKMFPLFDVSDTLTYGTEQELGANNWYGQLYYNIIQKSVAGKNYYTMFGFKAADQLTRRKIIDVLTFDDEGKPHFGAPLFDFQYTDTNSVNHRDTLSRFFIEYKWDASTVLNYDPELEMIVFDHVAPPDDKAKGATFSYVPDGTYEGFKWLQNHWEWVEKVFTFAINEDDNPPVPMPKFAPPTHQPKLPGEGDPR